MSSCGNSILLKKEGEIMEEKNKVTVFTDIKTPTFVIQKIEKETSGKTVYRVTCLNRKHIPKEPSDNYIAVCSGLLEVQCFIQTMSQHIEKKLKEEFDERFMKSCERTDEDIKDYMARVKAREEEARNEQPEIDWWEGIQEQRKE
jgi:hypothetical protein